MWFSVLLYTYAYGYTVFFANEDKEKHLSARDIFCKIFFVLKKMKEVGDVLCVRHFEKWYIVYAQIFFILVCMINFSYDYLF